MKKTPYDAILLLGVALKKNDEPTDELRARVKKAAEVYRKLGGKVPVMPCGGVAKGHKRTEAEVMASHSRVVTWFTVRESIPKKDRISVSSLPINKNYNNRHNRV